MLDLPPAIEDELGPDDLELPYPLGVAEEGRPAGGSLVLQCLDASHPLECDLCVLNRAPTSVQSYATTCRCLAAPVEGEEASFKLVGSDTKACAREVRTPYAQRPLTPYSPRATARSEFASSLPRPGSGSRQRRAARWRRVWAVNRSLFSRYRSATAACSASATSSCSLGSGATSPTSGSRRESKSLAWQGTRPPLRSPSLACTPRLESPGLSRLSPSPTSTCVPCTSARR